MLSPEQVVQYGGASCTGTAGKNRFNRAVHCLRPMYLIFFSFFFWLGFSWSLFFLFIFFLFLSFPLHSQSFLWPQHVLWAFQQGLQGARSRLLWAMTTIGLSFTIQQTRDLLEIFGTRKKGFPPATKEGLGMALRVQWTDACAVRALRITLYTSNSITGGMQSNTQNLCILLVFFGLVHIFFLIYIYLTCTMFWSCILFSLLRFFLFFFGNPWKQIQGVEAHNNMNTIWAASWESTTYLPLQWSNTAAQQEWAFVGGENRCGAYCTAWGCGANQTIKYTQPECNPQ